MKFSLSDPNFGLSLMVTICSNKHSDFLYLLKEDSKYNMSLARDSILLDVCNFIRFGLDPSFISKHTAKRIITFFGTSSNFLNYVYANR